MMRARATPILFAALLVFGLATLSSVATTHLGLQTRASDAAPTQDPAGAEAREPEGSVEELAMGHARLRLQRDLEAVQASRPAYSFWQHIFTIPDGAIAFGSAVDGRLLVTFPTRGNWARDAVWTDAALAASLAGQRIPAGLGQRRDHVGRLLEPAVGPVLHNATRGLSLLPNVRRYGNFLQEWATIYQRFGVPPEIGLAQAIVESGLNGTVRSKAGAVGFCQWLAQNWSRLDRLTSVVLEAQNQTTQAPYCAAYLTILATMYGSFLPALSEHHAGGANVGRTRIVGERLGGHDAREQYLLGSEFARDLRSISRATYRALFQTYGRRSAVYAEMVFGNTFNVATLLATVPQTQIFAMRATQPIPLTEITRRTGLSVDEVRRYNPALIRRVPAGATIYLPVSVPEYGPDISFWRRSPDPAYAIVLNDFLRLDVPPDRWDEPAFGPQLEAFQTRFRDTNTEEGAVMAIVLAYVRDDLQRSRRGAILDEFRSSARIRRLLDQAIQQREAFRASQARRRL